MNIAYFRKSNLSYEQTVKNVERAAKEQGWELLGELVLPEIEGKMFLVCKPEWVADILNVDHKLLGFLPCSITIFKRNGEVLIGSGEPAVLKAVSIDENIQATAAEIEVEVKKLIHEAADVDELKPSHIRLYSTQMCPYCKMEKSWLDSKNIAHEVVYVDQDQREAEAMVAKTGQMGVPVTEIQYNDGEPEFVIGFDRSRLSQILGIQD